MMNRHNSKKIVGLKKARTLALAFLTLTLALNAYPEKKMLFSHLTTQRLKEKNKESKELSTPELRQNGTQSNVYVVKGIAAFKSLVLDSAIPVIVKVHTAITQGSQETSKAFQDLADQFSHNALFVSLDIMHQVNGQAEHQQLIGSLMAEQNILKVQLPAYLFFHQGSLAQPVAVVQGDSSKDHIIQALQKNFSLAQ